MAILKQKQSELAEIEAHIQLLKDNIDGKNREFKVRFCNSFRDYMRSFMCILFFAGYPRQR